GFTGERVVLAILDSGVRYTHDDLEDHMWVNDGEIPANGIDDDMNGYTDDYHGYDFVNGDGDPWDDAGHGTNCAGLAAGDGNAGSQTGVAPDAQVMAIKVINSSGSGTPSGVVDGLQYALDMGASVVSLSLGWEDPDDAIKNYYRSVFEDVLTAGIVATVSAGNGSSYGGHYSVPHDISAPADGPSPSQSGASSNTAVVAVGAVNHAASGIADFSSYGPTEWNTTDYTDFPYPPGLMKPEIAAPGAYVRTTTYSSDAGYTNWFNGTSAACPIVAGAMALVLSKNPSLSPEQVDSLLQVSATDMGTAGRDNYFGAGLLNCAQLITDTPYPAFPMLSIEDHYIDDTPGDGSGIFDAGETVWLIVDVYNRGASATAVTVTAAIASDPYISVTDATSSLGTIATGATVDNTADPIELTAAPGTPPGHSVYVQLTTTSGTHSFVDTVQVSTGVYPRDYADHNTPTLATSVTNFGEFGFFDPNAPPASIMGQGFAFGDTNTLYGGGFFLGTGYNSVFTGEDGNASEFLPLMPLVIEATPSDTSYYTAYGAPETGLLISQKSTTFNSAPNEDFIIMRGIVKNRGSASYSALYIAFYLDFDIHATSDGTTVTWFDRAAFDSGNEWAYMWDEAATPRFDGVVGIVGLSGISTGSVIDNAAYIYPEGMGWDDTVKYNFMDGSFSASNGSPAKDWSVILAQGPFPLSPGDDYMWAVAVVAGSDLADWQANAAAARALYSTMSVEEASLPKKEALSVSPNPFNSSCKISLPDGVERLHIYDIAGREVNSIESHGESRSVVWNGRTSDGATLPSGVYFIRPDGEKNGTKVVYLR
ncbi:S8 family peptidase, partial [bacterium]|nr:S8 family peptidase [bacterium]